MRVRLLCLSTALTLVGWGCSTPDIEPDTCDHAQIPQGLAHDGPWQIPSDTLALGDTQFVTNTQAGPWRGESGCGGGLSEGAAELRIWLQANYPQILSIGGYSCRPINGNSSVMSVHATGRALDIMLPLDNGEADNDLGDPIGNYLIEHAEEIGIQYIIWDRWVWNGGAGAGSKSRGYGGAHPHHDHLHVELSLEAAARQTPFFRGSMDPPDMPACKVLEADGGTLDDAGPCFAAFGPARFWRQVDGQGIEGGLKWTNAFENDNPSNWARWRIHLAEAGRYTVEFHAVPEFAVYDNAEYLIRHAGEETTVHVDQSSVDGWQTLGVFDFAEGGGQHVDLYDNVSGTVAADQHIIADAVRLTRFDQDPDPDPTPTPDPQPDPQPEDDPRPDPMPDMSDPDPEDPGMFNPGDDATPEPAPFSQAATSKEACASMPASASTGGHRGLAIFGLLLLLVARRRRD